MKSFMTKCKKALSLALCIALCFNMSAPVMATEDAGMEDGIVASGACGDNLTWKLDDNGILTISGTGDMVDVEYSSKNPWYTYSANIEKVVVKYGVKSIGVYAFAYLPELKSVSIPESVTSIDSKAFYNSYRLKSVIIPLGVTSIGSEAFRYCEGLESVFIPDSVTSIGESAFSYCTALTSIVIPQGVTSIETYTFSNCYALTDVVINESVTTIGRYAFFGCDALNKIIIPKSVTLIRDGAFETYTNNPIETIYYEGTRYEWEQVSIGSDNSKLSKQNIIFIHDSGTCGAEGDGSNLIWKLYTNGTLTISGEGAMVDSTRSDSSKPWKDYMDNGIFDVCIMEGVTSIGAFAFHHCDYLSTVEIPNTVTSIGSNAFYCTLLTSVELPSGVTTIGQSAFSNCYKLKNVTISEGTTSIGDYAFAASESLVTITLPKSITKIGLDAFAGSSVQYVNFAGTENEWDAIKVDDGNANLLNKDIRYNSIESGNCGADGNNLIWKLSPEGVLTISGEGNMVDIDVSVDSPWYNRADIKEVVIESGVKNIEFAAFYKCSSLVNVTIPDSVMSIGSSAFYECSSLKSIIIPRHVTSIGNGTFEYCSSLTNVFIAGGVRSIARYAFSDCSALERINIPTSVKSIDVCAFKNCSELRTVYYSGTKEEWEKISIESSDNDHLINADVIYSQTFGTCGDNLTWELDSEGLLTISGTGDMEYYNSSNSVPWNDYRAEIRTVVIEAGVTSISKFAFSDCSILTSVTIPEGITSIGAAAFQNCRMLENVTLPASLTSIEHFAFAYCYSLTNVTIPAGVTRIDSGSFPGVECKIIVASENEYYHVDNNCLIETATNTLIHGNSKSVIPDYVTGIGSHAFTACDELISITIPEGVTSIGDSSFASCNGLTSVIIPSSVTSIASRAFAGCDALTSITIPTSVTSIGNHAFDSCGALTSVTILSSVTSIDRGTFDNCISLTSVTIPSSVTSVRRGAFWGCSALKTVYYSGTQAEWDAIEIESDNQSLLNANIIMRNGILASGTCGAEGDGSNLTWELDSEGTLTISGTGDMMSHDFLGIPWYDYRENIKSVFIEKGVTSIGRNAFNCCALTSITIPEGVTSIGESAFAGCRALTSITIPEGVTCISRSAFESCSALTSVTIPNGVTTIEYSAFSKCRSLASITIPESVTNIGDRAFRGADCEITVAAGNERYHVDGNCLIETATNTLLLAGSKSIMPNYVTRIGNCAFYECTALTELTIPEGVTSIGELAFQGCNALSNVILPESLTSIDPKAFRNCTALTNVTIPKGLNNIASGVFSNCDALQIVYYTGSEVQWADVLIGENNDPLLNATIHYNYVAEEEIPEEPLGNIGSIDAVITAPEGGWKVGENTFKVEAEKACFVAVSYDGGNTFMRVPAIQDANGGYRFTAENMDASTVVSVGYVGDVDGDGIIRARDARLALQAASGMEELSGLGHLAADLDNDGIIRAREARLMLQAASDMHTLDW